MSGNSGELAVLRAALFRLSSTAALQLPSQVPAIASSLANCKALLSSPQISGPKSSTEASVAIHKYRTLLSTLLQDRTCQGRWAAIVLIKATTELGGWETLQKSLPWVRGLLGVLTKPDPPSSKKLCLIALTRIFTLTREYPTLTREITTPSLPTFIQSCLQIAASTPSLVQTVLDSFNQLLPRHPAMFRSYTKQLHQLLDPIVAPTPSNKLGKEQHSGAKSPTSSAIADSARRVYVQLPCCAPKQGSAQEWEGSLKNTISNAHQIADNVFRAVVEDWQPSSGGVPFNTNGHTLDDEVQQLEADSLALPPWSGIYAGGERLVGVLQLIKAYLSGPTPTAVNVPVGPFLDLLTRILSLNTPSSVGTKSFSHATKFNNQVSKEERENLWAILPHVHVAAIEVLLALLERCEDVTGADPALLDQLVWLFRSEKANVYVRTASYVAFSRLLSRSGAALPKSSIDTLGVIIRACCDDLLPQDLVSTATSQPPTDAKTNGAGHKQQSTTNADEFLKSGLASQDRIAGFDGLKHAAFNLLPILLGCIRPQYLSDSLRTRMDRTAILSRHEEAMLASVMNPPPSKRFGKPAASVLPLMARLFSDKAEVECLLRPRMPTITTGAKNTEDGLGEAETVEDVEDEEEEEGNGENEHFVGDELDTLLGSAAHTGDVVGDVKMADNDTVENDPDLQASALPDLPVQISTQDEDASEPTTVIRGSKRPQANDTATTPPPKKVKVGEPPIAETLTTFTTPSLVSATAPIIASIHAPKIGAEQDEVSEDDDDFGELVLGQDTDEESDL
ncbi:hypothetical protein P154DRAFT_526599 [Amniculicola lignicola CBS 123094]|uniref:Pre-rRNA-processing protein RIX1 n=1 Tax=Amniculicola lignicola CBS 123094 TaxID=1392246 RepID=A0A6A5W092_9PLEO|nr:hypothetical protein P154DRAFT_526599 [Amniculicola lignicola CBS 123094]